MSNDNIVNVAMDKDYYDQVMSGGGSGGGSTDPNDDGYIEYIIYPNLPNLIYYTALVKLEMSDNKYAIMPVYLALNHPDFAGKPISAMAILPNTKIANEGMYLTYKEVFKQMGVDYDNYTRLTKEQFYNLNE